MSFEMALFGVAVLAVCGRGLGETNRGGVLAVECCVAVTVVSTVALLVLTLLGKGLWILLVMADGSGPTVVVPLLFLLMVCSLDSPRGRR